MKKRILSLVFAIFIISGFADQAQCQTQMVDVVSLRNGSIIVGTIIEQIPNQTIKIRTMDGSVLVYNMDEIAKLGRERAPIYVNQNQNNQTRSYNEVKPNGMNKRLPLLAFGLSFIVPGAGQVYNGEVGKGATHFLASVAGLAAMSIGMGMEDKSAGKVVSLSGAALALTFSLVSIIDAPIMASKLNKANGFALRGDKYLKFSPDIRLAKNLSNLTPAYCMKASLSF